MRPTHYSIQYCTTPAATYEMASGSRSAVAQLPTLKDHNWTSEGLYKIGGASNNKKGVPTRFLLAFIIAESSKWCKATARRSQFVISSKAATSPSVPDAVTVRLVDAVQENAEVRCKQSVLLLLYPPFVYSGGGGCCPQFLSVFGVDVDVAILLSRGSTDFMSNHIWRHGEEMGDDGKKVKKSFYVIGSDLMLDWIFEQAAHLRMACFKGGVSRVFALTWTLEKEG
jgi:hypothetical protein